MLKTIFIATSSLILLTSCQSPQSSTTQSIKNNEPSSINNPAVKKHNALRQQHFVGSKLSYSLKLEKEAQTYVNKLAQSGKFEHDPSNIGKMYGENLYRHSSTQKPNLNKIIQKWYDEKKYYDMQTQKCQTSKVCGHYTQVVWKNSKLLGCASAKYTKGSYKNGYVTICKYYPYGNIQGENPY